MSEDSEVLQKMDLTLEDSENSFISPFEQLYSTFENYHSYYTANDLELIKEYISK
jgi:hypothetical protein